MCFISKQILIVKITDIYEYSHYYEKKISVYNITEGLYTKLKNNGTFNLQYIDSENVAWYLV